MSHGTHVNESRHTSIWVLRGWLGVLGACLMCQMALHFASRSYVIHLVSYGTTHSFMCGVTRSYVIHSCQMALHFAFYE